MKKIIGIAVAAMLALPAFAATNNEMQDEIAQLKAQLKALETRLDAQSERSNRLEAQQVAVEQQALRMEQESLSMLENFAQLKAVSDAISVSGNIDIVGFVSDADYDTATAAQADEDEENIYLDQFTLQVSAEINDNVTGVIGLRLEQGPNTWSNGGVAADANDGQGGALEDIQLELAYIDIDMDNGTSLTVGKQYMPFGNYATNFIDDTLPQQLGEVRDTGVVFGWNNDSGVVVELFAFNGISEQTNANAIHDNDEVDTWGGRIVYSSEQEDTDMKLGLGYTNNLLQSQESFTLNATGATFGHEVDAVNAFATIESGALWVSAEMVHALRSTDPAVDLASSTGNSREPFAYAVELGFTVESGDREWLLMAKWEDAEEISPSNATIPIEHKWGLGVATDIYTNTKLTLNYINSRQDISVLAGREDATLEVYAAELSVNF
jgi:hypothetical protein